MNPPLSLYVHFPWCVRKCPYCDFNSHPLKDGLPEQQYLSFLLADLETEWSHAGQRPFETVFFGGGTPSLFSPDTFAALLSTLGHAPHEITLEANPGTTEHRDLGACRQAGINRLSLGAQSFDDDMLTRLGRIHKAADTTRSFARARDGGFDNINLDIMYGLPGQTVDGALDDLRHAIALGVEHISWYELTLEPRTVFHRQPPVLPDEDILLTIETEGRALLTDAGYERYEVSAWARPGRRCAHNLNYWHYGDYLGVGAGAHGKLTQGAVVTRSAKASQPRLYMTADRIDTYAAVPAERIPGEFFLNVLRTVDGLEFGAFELRTGLPWSAVAERWNHGVAAGLLRSNRIATTPMGFRYLDSVLQPFL
ncbi:MAG: radical SAM family heme chaperone HemW [Pseudomonadales bacterium]